MGSSALARTPARERIVGLLPSSDPVGVQDWERRVQMYIVHVQHMYIMYNTCVYMLYIHYNTYVYMYTRVYTCTIHVRTFSETISFSSFTRWMNWRIKE